MTNILVYDETEKLIENLAEQHDMTEAEVVDMILTQLDDDEIDSMLP